VILKDESVHYNASNHSCLIGPYGEGENLKIGYAWPIKRYYESYKYSLTRHEFSNRILGDRELGSFNVDYLISWYLEFIRGTDTNFPWIVRGRETISN